MTASTTPGTGHARTLSTPDAQPMSRREITAALVGQGFDRDEARAAMARYLRDTSERVGFPIYQWALDSHDLDCIATDYTPTREDPVDRARDAVAALPDVAEHQVDDEAAPLVQLHPDTDDDENAAADGDGS